MCGHTLSTRGTHRPSLSSLPASSLNMSTLRIQARIRAADTLAGTLWLVGPAATDHLGPLLAALSKTVEDSDEGVARQVRRCAQLVGRSCDLAVYVPLVLDQLRAPSGAALVGSAATAGCGGNSAGGGADFLRGGGHSRMRPAAVTVLEGAETDAGAIGRRAGWLSLLGELLAGATAEQLRPHLSALLATVARPVFCVPGRASDDDAGASFAATQLRLCSFLGQLISSAGAACASGDNGLLLYSALMRVASVPSSAQHGFASQRRAIECLSAMAAAVDGGSAEALHAVFLPPLLAQITAGETYKSWKVDSAEWHLFQALCRQAGGATCARVLLLLLPPLAAVLSPKEEPTLRLTALSLLDSLLSAEGFLAAPEWAEMGEHVLAAMLLPNAVWRAGKPAEHVRLASYSCVQKLLSADAISGEQLGAHMGGALPLLVAGLDDDNVESRRIACVILATALRRLGPSRVSHEQMRQLYPELTKRLDDASDGVRVAACVPLVAMLEQVRYSASWSEAHNFDRTNFGYFVNGLLVHLDDPDPEIQAAVAEVLERAAPIDPPEFCSLVRAVRGRHRSSKLCDALLENAGGHTGGTLV
uniref:Dynein axonemal assembly factor 5 HEAT-repeat domain-containing protein n=1 Tax=Emiliania huxleyi TaxID=2903 RepID=A0A7S3SDL0_EMIHU